MYLKSLRNGEKLNLNSHKLQMKTALGFILFFTFYSSFAQNYSIKNLEMNDDKSQYGLVYYQEKKVYFTSYMLDERNKVRRDKDKHLIYTLFEGEQTENGEIINVKQFNKSHKFLFNSSSAAFSLDGKYMYITTNFIKKGKTYKQDYKSVNLHIERGEFIEGKGWTNFETLSFCDANYSYGHPALSPDGSTLYFVSNIPSAKGPTDIFRIPVLGNNTFGEIENLGHLVNSPRKEMFPYVSSDNILYFASDRVGGIGGLDIYKYDLKGDTKAQILPQPINSRSDDFCFILDKNGKTGYISSTRPKGKGEDDIYYFTIE